VAESYYANAISIPLYFGLTEADQWRSFTRWSGASGMSEARLALGSVQFGLPYGIAGRDSSRR
jgi:hypothetical protein